MSPLLSLLQFFSQNAKNNAIDFKQNLHEKNVSLSAITFSFDQFDEKINLTKISKSSNFEVMGCKGNYSFIQSFAYLFIFIRF